MRFVSSRCCRACPDRIVRAALAVAFACIAAGACVTRTPAPVVDRTPPPAAQPQPAPELLAQPAPPVTEIVPPAAPPQPDWRPEFYTVKRGDTLFQIALEHGLDYRELAALNNVEN